jgi:hypothetical protein
MNQQFGIPAGRTLAAPLPDEPAPEVPTVDPVPEPLATLLLDEDVPDPDLDRT